MTNTANPRDPLPSDVVAKLLDPGERECVVCTLKDAQSMSSPDGFADIALTLALETIADLYRLVDQLRAEVADQVAHDNRLAEVSWELANDVVAAADKSKQLEAENDHLWEAVASLHDHLTEDQIDAELRRCGIVITDLPEVIRRARAKGRGGAGG